MQAYLPEGLMQVRIIREFLYHLYNVELPGGGSQHILQLHDLVFIQCHDQELQQNYNQSRIIISYRHFYLFMQQQIVQGPPTSTTKYNKVEKRPERITQLQCLDNNSQLQLFFIQSLNESFKYLPNILAHIYNQLELLVALAQYRLTIAVNKPHPGDLLQNIKYRSASMKTSIKILYLFLTVIIPYVKRKIQNYCMKNPMEWKEKVLSFLNVVDKVIMGLNLLNFSVFIYNGTYRTLSQRILKIPMEFINGQSARVLDFTLMNRKLIWNVYQLFLKTIFPYANDLFGSTLRNIFYLNSYIDVEENKNNICMFCQEKVKLPMETQCKHVACYYCYYVNTKQRDNQKQNCRTCGANVNSWKKLF